MALTLLAPHFHDPSSHLQDPALLISSKALLGYLEHAAGVARDRFCSFNLRAMAAGCALMVASIALHLFVVTR